MEYLLEFAVFFGKSVVVVLVVLAIATIIASLLMRAKAKDEITVEKLNDKFDAYDETLRSVASTKKELKKLAKEHKKLVKREAELSKPTMYVLDFHGDLRATTVENLGHEVSAVLSVAKSGDEVLLRLESPGGMVHAYGLAAAQLLRFRNGGVNVTIAVDKIAASGGYLMAVTGHKIIASHFAILGSIGVLAQVPNFNRFLKKHNIDYEELTAGEYKRTLSLLGEVTDKGRKKFLEQIEDTHGLFKKFVAQLRPQLDMEKVATGEYWYGQRALDLNLVDELMTSDDFLFQNRQKFNLVHVSIKAKKPLLEKFSLAASHAVDVAMDQIFQRSRQL